MPLALEFAAKLGEVINLSVVGYPYSTVFVAHRHAADGGEIENGQAAAAQANVRTIGKLSIPQAGIVGPAMRQDLSHPRQSFPVAAIHHTADATHCLSQFPCKLCLRLAFSS